MSFKSFGEKKKKVRTPQHKIEKPLTRKKKKYESSDCNLIKGIRSQEKIDVIKQKLKELRVQFDQNCFDDL